MNFLAHCFLSCGQEEWLVGNFLADYIGNSPLEQYPAGVQKGILLHRKIDSYTDVHPEVLSGVRRLYSNHHKYAPVVIDVFYDYLLSQNWELYSGQLLREFTQSTYKILMAHLEWMPSHLKKNLPLMIADDWLMSYGTKKGLAYTFSRLRNRLSRPEHLEGVMDSLERDMDLLNAEFNRFFPDVIAYVQESCPC
ncbi:MAG: ACP phosphodiesterase [Chitinophagales bacterium]|nr:ACP phosphodiesterase [Chitinophagales bacterium]